MTGRHTPVVYGAPDQISVLLESVARVVEGEPWEVLADPDVRGSAQRLSTLLRRIIEGEDQRVSPHVHAALPDG
jgi:hypothetical protein